MRGGPLLVAAAFLFLAVGCGESGSDEVVAGGSGDPAGFDSDGNLQVIVAPGSDLIGSAVEIGCPNGPRFPASALADVPPIEESGLTGIAEAIEPFLSSGEGDFWPQTGWRVLNSSDERVQLVHIAEPPPADGSVTFMTVEGSDGAWRWAGSSGASPCPLKTTLPAGLNTVDWELDPEVDPDPISTSLQVLATERECVSGQPMGDRLRGPQVVLTEDAVLIAFAAVPPPGNEQECPGNPSTTVTIELPEALGDRTIRDGFDVGANLADFLG